MGSYPKENCQSGVRVIESIRGKESASAESIARLAEEGQDVSSYFTNDGKMMPPLQSEIDLREGTIQELNEAARENQGTDSPL